MRRQPRSGSPEPRLRTMLTHSALRCAPRTRSGRAPTAFGRGIRPLIATGRCHNIANRCVSAPHDDMRRRRRESHGWRGLACSGRVVGPRARAEVIPPGFGHLIPKTRSCAQNNAQRPSETHPGTTRTNPRPIKTVLGERGRPEVTGGDRRRPEATGGDRRRPEAKPQGFK